MEKMTRASLVIKRLEEQAQGDTLVHRVSPLCKLIVAIIYIGVTTSYDKYDLSGLIIMILFPIIWFQFAKLNVSECFIRFKLILPVICAVGLVNPFLDRSIMLNIRGFDVTGGMISMVTLILKGMLCVMTSYLFVATTQVEELCYALRRVRVPQFFVTLVLLTFRFISVLLDEASIMMEAYRLRAPGQNGIHISAWGSFLGQLILRSIDRAQDLYEAMILRGYDGVFVVGKNKKISEYSVIIAIVNIVLLIIVRYINVVEILGAAIR